MRFPLILIKNEQNPCPELITAPWQLGQPGLDVLQKRDTWVGSNCYMDGVHSRIISVKQAPRQILGKPAAQPQRRVLGREGRDLCAERL